MDNIVNRGNKEMIEKTKLAAFYLWQYTGYESTLALWYCAEDVASFFERCQLYTEESVMAIIRINKNEREYRSFIRHIAYRLHLYTGIQDDGFNWQASERLLDNKEWLNAIIFLASGMNAMRSGHFGSDDYRILSPTVKEYYTPDKKQ